MIKTGASIDKDAFRMQPLGLIFQNSASFFLRQEDKAKTVSPSVFLFELASSPLNTPHFSSEHSRFLLLLLQFPTH